MFLWSLWLFFWFKGKAPFTEPAKLGLRYEDGDPLDPKIDLDVTTQELALETTRQGLLFCMQTSLSRA